jgi:hypothetical protein
MSRSYALAHAARRVRSLADRLPPSHRHLADAEIARSWGELLDELEDSTNSRALYLIDLWTERMERRLCSTLTNAPLEESEVT